MCRSSQTPHLTVSSAQINHPLEPFEIKIKLWCGFQSSGIFFFKKKTCWPSGQLPDCVLCRHVSRSCQYSKSVWRPSLSTMSVTSFEPVRFLLCTFVPESIHHWSICTPHYYHRKNVRKAHHCKPFALFLSVFNWKFHYSLSSHLRVWMVVSAGPRSLSVFSLIFFPLPSQVFCVRWTISHCQGRTSRLGSSPQEHFSFFVLSSSLLRQPIP